MYVLKEDPFNFGVLHSFYVWFCVMVDLAVQVEVFWAISLCGLCYMATVVPV